MNAEEVEMALQELQMDSYAIFVDADSVEQLEDGGLRLTYRPEKGAESTEKLAVLRKRTIQRLGL